MESDFLAANFEIYIIHKKYVAHSKILKLFNFIGQDTALKALTAYQDWTYSNGQQIGQKTANIKELLQSGCIVQGEGLLQNCHRIGIRQFYEDDQKYTTELWINTQFLPCLDKDYADTFMCDFLYLFNQV